MNQMQDSPFLQKQDSIFIAGHRGMVGSAIQRQLTAKGFTGLVTRSRAELELTDQRAVADFFRKHDIDVVVLAAAKVGGIQANTVMPADFIYQNLMIESNVMHAAVQHGVDRLLFLGSSCIYPKNAVQPMSEESLLSGYLEPTNEPYAVAKIAGIKLCQSYNRQHGTDFRAVMPTNLYGPRDNFDLENSHVLPALIRKYHLAELAMNRNRKAIEKDEAVFGPIPTNTRDRLLDRCRSEKPPGAGSEAMVTLWGSGSPRREFLHVDDLAAACFSIMSLSRVQYRNVCMAKPGDASTDLAADKKALPSGVSHINIGAGKDVTIKDLAGIVKSIVGYIGAEDWDLSMPDGTPRKLLDITRLTRTGWRPRIELKEGIGATYEWYRRQTE